MDKFNPNIHHRKSIRLKGYDYSQAGLYFITIATQNHLHLFGEIVLAQMILNDAGQMIKNIWENIPIEFSNTRLHEYIIMPNHLHGIVEITVGADSISAQTADSISAQTTDSISAQTMDSISAQTTDSISAQTTDSISAQTTDSISAQTADSISAQTADSISAQTTDSISAQITDSISAQTTDSISAQTMDSISAQTADSISAQTMDSISAQTTDSISDYKNGARTRAEIDSAPTGMDSGTADIPTIIQSFKRHTTIEYIKMVKQNILPRFDKKIWQRNYWEHIVRNETEHHRITQYIVNNPKKWQP